MISSSPRADGRDRGRDLDHLIVVEIKAGHRIVRFRLLRLFLDRQRLAGGVDLEHAVALRIRHHIAENRRAFFARGGLGHQLGQPVAVEDIVAENQRDMVVADEIAADDEGVGKPARLLLHRIGQREAELRAVAQQRLEQRLVAAAS